MKAPGRRCSAVGCGNPPSGRRGTCAAHTRALEVAVDRHRGTASSRGYGARWRHYRTWYLEAYPLCGDRAPGAPETRDSVCARARRLVPATVVDHIKPVTGPADPNFFESAAHQSLCEHCHNAKRQREARPTGGLAELEVGPCGTS